MKLGYLFKSIVAHGKLYDPRLNSGTKLLYPDTAILYGNIFDEIKKLIVGIDVDIGEVLLADRLRTLEGIDLILSHHPQGNAAASLADVLPMQLHIFENFGLRKSVGMHFMDERIREAQRKLHPINHGRAVAAARLLRIPFMCVHTPADNMAAAFVRALLVRLKPKIVQDIITILSTIPEYQENSAGVKCPVIVLGNPKRRIGKIFVDMTGGMQGPKDIYYSLSRLGIKTIVAMHCSEEHLKSMKNADLNVVVAGHIASDTLGMNLLLDKLEAIEKLDILSFSGFHRICR